MTRCRLLATMDWCFFSFHGFVLATVSAVLATRNNARLQYSSAVCTLLVDISR